MKFGYQNNTTPIVFILLLLGVVTYLFIANYQKEEALLKVRKELAKKTAESIGKEQRLQKFSLTGYDNQGKKFWNLEGQTANIDASQKIFLEDEVNLTFQENTLINTDKVEWSQERGLLTTSSMVYVDHVNAKIKGLGAIGKPSDNFVQLNRHVDMILNGNTRITAKGPMKIFYNENRIEIFRNVRIRDGRGTLTSRRMDVFFDPTTKKINKVIALGDVIINRGGDTSRSKKAIYSVDTGSVRLEGNPQISVHHKNQGVSALDGIIGG